jgi:hypothetical protein
MKRSGCALLALFAVASLARAEERPTAPALNAAGAGPAQQQKLPDDFKLNMLIRSTVIAVNQANKTNNYTVLRDLGSPRFKEANSAKKLADIFEALRKTKFDLTPILFFTPQMQSAPVVADNGMLRLTGYFDTVPQRINFDFLFEDVGGEWMIYGLNISTQSSPAVQNRSATSPSDADLSAKK